LEAAVDLPNRGLTQLFHSPLGLFPFQAEGMVDFILRSETGQGVVAVWSQGLGKTLLALASACLLFEDDLIDQVVVVCEKNKYQDWIDDTHRFTDLDVRGYSGTLAQRAKIRSALPQVLVGVYETVRNDCAQPLDGYKRKLGPGPLTEALRGSRTLLVYDEVGKLGHRSSGLHRAHEVLVTSLRNQRGLRLLGLTATPVERSPESFYDIGRLVDPTSAGSVQSFLTEHVSAVDFHGKPFRFMNLTPEDTSPRVVSLRDKLAPMTLVKSKLDADVRDQFPKRMELPPIWVELPKRHAEFYSTVQKTFSDASPLLQQQVFTSLRQIAAWPAALQFSEGEVGKLIVDEVGVEGLEALGSAKADALIEYLRPIVSGQGSQCVVFTFFGQSVLRLLRDKLVSHGYELSINHGQMTDQQRSDSKAKFIHGDSQIFLTSDAGSRGLNLGNAEYVTHLELPLLYSTYVQRSDRIHRIDSDHPISTIQSFVVRDTVEEGIASLVLRRNQWDDDLVDGLRPPDDDDDDGFERLSASMRKALFVAGK
jgi:SNF2 family DNA or RNA helicase